MTKTHLTFTLAALSLTALGLLSACAAPDDTATATAPLSAKSGGFYYDQLPDDEKTLYNALDAAVANQQVCLTVDGFSADQVKQVISCLLLDQPQLFWYSGRGTLKTLSSAKDPPQTFYPDYDYPPERIAELQQQIDEVTVAFIASLPQFADDYQKALLVHDYLIDHTAYDPEADDLQNLVSALVNGKAVCNGYAKAAQYLLQQSGVFAALVKGDFNDTLHAWDLLLLDGDYYYLDVTLDDPRFSGEDIANFRSYDYFCLTTEELFKTHTPSADFTLPLCLAKDADYFYRNGLLLKTADKNTLSRLIEAAIAHREPNVLGKFADQDSYEQAVDLLYSQGLLDEVLSRYPQAQAVYHTQNHQLLTLTINLSY